MVLLVDVLLKSAGELLHGVDQDLKPLPVHLKRLGKRCRLSLDQTFGSENHVVLDLPLVHVDLALGLVVLLYDGLGLFGHHYLRHEYLCHHLDRVFGLLLKPRPLQLLLVSSILPRPLDLVNLGVDLHGEPAVELLAQSLELHLVSRDGGAADQDHESAPQDPRPDVLLAERFLLLEYFPLKVCIYRVLLGCGLEPGASIIFALLIHTLE